MTAAMGGIAAAAPAIAMLGAIACVIGGGWMIASGRDRMKGALLLVMAAVLVGNVLIWTM